MVKKKRTKVAIVGGCPASQMKAPFDDDEWEIWVLGNQLNAYDGKGASRVFEIHEDLSEHEPGYAEWLVVNAPRLVVSDAFPIKKHPKQRTTIEVYPKEEITKIIGGHLSSSPAYMMGYAVWKGCFDEIGIYGIDMAVNNHEYFKQRPDMYAWIGYCLGKGIKITIPEETPIFGSEYDEGRDWGNKSTVGPPPFTMKNFTEMADYHRGRVVNLNKQLDSIKTEISLNEGCVQSYDHMAHVARAVGTGAKIDNLKNVTWMPKIAGEK